MKEVDEEFALIEEEIRRKNAEISDRLRVDTLDRHQKIAKLLREILSVR